SFTGGSPQAIAQMKYSTMLVDIQNGGLDENSRIVDVNSLGDLAKIAERFNAMILHETREDEHIYFVRADGATYRFSTGRNSGGSAGEKPN
ncbi:MAG TPA: hypothetical protein VFI68_07645, partial [Anaerolineales bacterium]|nr:hypothetical protein [Anaerolineales bacterium]